MKAPSRVWALTASLVLTGTLAACSSDATTDNAATPTSPPPSATTSVSSPTAQPATVMTASSDLGTILVDGTGMTLYLFTKDTQGSGQSTCEGDCLAAWPPLLGEPQAGEGTDPALLGTITRSDGSTQVSYNGWPLYYWAQDAAPGDTTGQGVNEVWWVLDANGDAIGAP
jgi:predicted lipoprotein with Yx(FWY)xxD motif